MVSKMTLTWSPNRFKRYVGLVDDAMKRVVTANDGWKAVPLPKPGWYTNGSSVRANQSFFSIALRNISADADHLTVISMKSYGPQWAGSRIGITVEVASPSSPRRPRIARYFVEGHHDKPISVSYPHRFRLPGNAGGGAKAGDTIRARFTNVGRTQFKIIGLAICEMAMSE
jgi:hypothetical protein